MNAPVSGLTRGGIEWTPAFVTDLNQADCIGCGRCFKACPRDVFDLVDREDLDLADDDDDDDWDDDEDGFSDDTSMVMALKDLRDCIGCQACSRVCPKNCLSHATAAELG